MFKEKSFGMVIMPFEPKLIVPVPSNTTLNVEPLLFAINASEPSPTSGVKLIPALFKSKVPPTLPCATSVTVALTLFCAKEKLEPSAA